MSQYEHPYPIIFISGPRACGKTYNAERLKEMFMCHRIVDDWDGVTPLKPGDLVLTNLKPKFEPHR